MILMAHITTCFNTGIRCTSGWTAPPYWAASTTYPATDEWGAGVKPTVSNGHNYLLTKSGTTGSSDPFNSSDRNWEVISDGSAEWTCFDIFTNPTDITGKPFGHGFSGSLWYLYYVCSPGADIVDIDSTYLSGRTYNVNTLSSQHEVASVQYIIHSDGDLSTGHTYTVKEIWKKGGNIIWYACYEIQWQLTWYRVGTFIGWSPCWWWAYGSNYDGYEEITDNGTDYLVRIELWDGSTLICASEDEDNDFTVSNLNHTTIYWNHIKDYPGEEIGGNFGMQALKYVHDLGTDTWINAWYRQKNLDYDASLIVDGFDGSIDLKAFRSGYVQQTRSCTGVTDKDMNGPYDFTGSTNYLRASVEGIVQDGDNNALENANVFGMYGATMYGAKVASDGKYALPFHTGGNYQIRARKNNHVGETLPDTVYQGGDHPTARTEKNFTGTYKLERRTDYPQGAYAHLDSLAVDGQSVIIPDDPITSTAQIKPTSVGASIVKVKTRKWGAGAAQSTTSTGGSNGGTGFGSGGLDYDGDMGDAENWTEES